MNNRTAFPVLLGTALAAVILAPRADAQRNRTQEQLAAATRVECSFTALATADWENDVPSAGVTDASLEAAFFDINLDEGTAEAEGRFGSTFIIVRHSNEYLHFLQMSDAGPLHLTTVLAQQTADGRLKGIHTRHEYSPTMLPGFTSRPEMYVGSCAVTGE